MEKASSRSFRCSCSSRSVRRRGDTVRTADWVSDRGVTKRPDPAGRRTIQADSEGVPRGGSSSDCFRPPAPGNRTDSPAREHEFDRGGLTSVEGSSADWSWRLSSIRAGTCSRSSAPNAVRDTHAALRQARRRRSWFIARKPKSSSRDRRPSRRRTASSWLAGYVALLDRRHPRRGADRARAVVSRDGGSANTRSRRASMPTWRSRSCRCGSCMS